MRRAEKYAWIQYNDREILEYDQRKTDELVKSFADSGAEILIGFSVTHFRWSFYRHWGEINACIARLVCACHKYGMKYVEHHSCTLTFNPLTPEDRKYAENLFAFRNSDPSHWEGFWEDAYGDFEVDGKPVSGFRQISGRSGKAGVSTYHGYSMCYNNPDFRKAYFDYLKSLYEVGIDGIMTDDIQYFGNDGMGWKAFNACTCEHCRRLFRKQTGYEIPQPEDWEKFYWDFNNPVFVAWKRFKDESTLRFARDVVKHYTALGYEMLRPNYISDVIPTNKTAYPFERCADIWSCVFQENCSSDIISQSYLNFSLEAMHRFCMARSTGVSNMSMFYPCTQSAAFFSWSLAALWGQGWSQSSQNSAEFFPLEKRLHDFETAHPEIFDPGEKITDAAFLLSQSTRDYADGCEELMQKFLIRMQAAYVSGIGTDMVFEYAPLSEMKKHKVIIAAYAAMIPPQTMKNLESYVNDGGKLIVIGDFDALNTDGTPKTERCFACENGKHGKGSVVRIADDGCAEVYQGRLAAARVRGEEGRVACPPYAIEKLRNTGGKLFNELLGESTLTVDTCDDLLTSTFAKPDCHVIHIVNIGSTVAKSGDTSHFDELADFVQNAEPHNSKADITLGLPLKPSCVALLSPEREDALNLCFISDGESLRFTVPENTFSGYCAIVIK